MSFEWATLVTINPEKPTIHFFTTQNPTATNQYLVEGLWRVYQDPADSTWIENLSPSYYIKVESSRLIKNERKMLTGREKIAFNQMQKDDPSNPHFDYVFCLKTPQQENHLKRSRSFESSEAPSLGPKIPEKALKHQESLQEELTCAICRETLYNCVTVNPCQHNFCAGCLSETLEYSLKCPSCRGTIYSVKRNHLLHALIESIRQSSPRFQRPKDECLSLDARDRISKGYNIIRDKLGCYVGYTLNNKREGRGRLTYTNGSIYEGMWRQNKKEGEGKITCQNGTVYEGTWSNDSLQQIAVIKYNNGNHYKGETKQYKVHGKGVFTYKNGDVFDGNFVNGLGQGLGTFTWKNGSVYTGNWAGGVRNGYGTLVQANNKGVYVGDWKNNKMDGEGSWTQENGDTFSGKWLAGVLQSPAKIYYKDGQVYEGEVENFKRHGKGIFYLESGDTCEGSWIQDVLQGRE